MADQVVVEPKQVTKYQIAFQGGNSVIIGATIWEALKEKMKAEKTDNQQNFFDEKDNLIVGINLDHVDYILPVVTQAVKPTTSEQPKPTPDAKPLDNDNTNTLQSNNDTKAN